MKSAPTFTFTSIDSIDQPLVPQHLTSVKIQQRNIVYLGRVGRQQKRRSVSLNPVAGNRSRKANRSTYSQL